MTDSGSSEKKSADYVQQPRPRPPKLERIPHRQAQHDEADEDLDRAWCEWETTFDAIQDSVMLLDGQFNIIQANAATSRLLGRPLDEIVGNKCWQLVHGTDEPPEGCPLSKSVSTKERHKTELYIPQKDMWTVVSVDPILDEQGNVTGLVHLLADITDHKKAEKALRESQEHFRNIFENAVVGLYRTTPDGRILMANPAILRMLGYSSFEELADRNLEQYGFAPHSPRSVFKERIEAEGEVFGLESAWTKRDGTTLCLRESAKAVRDADGNTLYYEGTVEDITERKKAEEALQKSVRLLRDTGEMAKVGGWELDLSTNEVSWTEEVGRIHGVEPGYKPKLEEALNFYAPESRAAVEAVVKKAAETGEPYDLESLFIPLGGKDKIWVRSLGKAVYSGGKIVKLAGTFQNIDKYKRAEQQVRQSEQKYKELFESAREAIIILDLNGKITDANRIVEEYGHTRDYLLGKSIFDFIPVNHRARAAKDFDDLCHGTPVKGEMEVIAPKGNLTVEYRDNPIVRGGQIVAVQAILMDITERKRAEEALQAERQRLHDVLEAIPIMVCLLTPDYHVAFANRAFREKFGESHGRRCYEYCFGKKEPCDFCETYRVLETAKPHHWQATTADGASVIDVYDFPFTDVDGLPMILEMDIDITERKKAEEKIKIFSDAIASAFDCLMLTDGKGNFTYANESACTTFGYTPQEFLKLNITKLDADPEVAKKIAQEVATKGDWSGEVINIRKNREKFPSFLSAFIIRDDQGKLKGTMGILRDITEQKLTEQALRDHQAELKSLALELALAEERERRRIAAGIHDDIGQKLALAKMELQLLARSPGKSKIPASLDGVCARIDEAIKDAHSLTFELSNPALYDLSFAAAIDQWLLERIQKKHGIKCRVIAGEQAVPLDENSRVVLFRALRELAVNVVKHAKATALTVTIEKLENTVQITCKDDGLGFTPPEDNALPRDVGGFGLFNIKERLEYLGGGMKLESAPGRGTLITLSLPLERKSDADADEGRQ